jgi:hypothetical protein
LIQWKGVKNKPLHFMGTILIIFASTVIYEIILGGESFWTLKMAHLKLSMIINP